jgi:lipopolysaccharide transport system ATP-binding protein
MKQAAIILEHVSKTYAIGAGRQRDLKSTLRERMFRLGMRQEEFYALEDINLRIDEGDVVGIVGSNGSGKTTLLKLLNRVSAPTEGKIRIRGKLSAMLEVRIGFHPELTGMENIFLFGALMGMKRSEVKNCLDSIVEFSGLEKFLATPIKHYSSGMYVKLAFAVAIHMPVDILLLDEVLNFIDMEFQQRSIARLKEFKAQGRTMVLVSHQLNLLEELCDRGIFLDKGQVAYYGRMEDTIQAYRRQFA